MSARPGYPVLALAACLALELPLGVAAHAASTVPAAPVAASPTAGVMLRDDLKREVAIAHAPQRLISLMPSLTETVCALGACDRLIATDRFSDWPPQVRGLPKAGGLDDPEIELIVSMKPDLVLISSSQRITNRLHELGIATFALNTESYTDIDRDVSVIGEILGLSARATSLTHAIESAVHEVSEQAVARHRGAEPSVYYEVDRTPIAAGAASFIGELLTRLGTRNIVTADLGPFPALNPEYVVRGNPDVIFVSRSAEAVHLAERPGWNQIRAVRERRLCYFAPTVRDTIERAGPRVAEGMRAMAECLARVAP